MVFDFGALPPEINSTRMYAGAGAGPMMAAASAWNSLAAELDMTASSCQAVISMLTGEEWTGPASASMAAAAEPYIGWMSSTAAQLQHAASQATASAAAYETAFAMTVPPPVIAANRAQLAALVATNILGQNTPAMAATEVHYGEMWAQDAVAMYGYAGSSASAGTLTPLTSPAPTTNPGGLAGQAAAVSQASASAASAPAGLPGLVSNLPSAVQSLASPLAGSSGATGAGSGLNDLFGNSFVSTAGNAIFDTAAWNLFGGVASAIIYGHTVGAPAAVASDTLGAGLGSGTVLAGAVGPTGGFGGAPVLAGMGSASSVGGLSVPAGWSAATPASSPASALEGSGWAAAPEESASATAVPAGMPSVATAGKGYGFGGPRYGFKPTVMPKTVLV